MVNLRCTSDGFDLGDNDITQLVYDAVVVDLKLVLVEHEYDKHGKLEKSELQPFMVTVVGKLSSSQAKLEEQVWSVALATSRPEFTRE